SDEERELEWRGERLHHADRDDGAALGQLVDERLQNEGEDGVREGHARHESDADRNGGANQPVPQLQKMRDERAFLQFFGRLFLGWVGDGSPCRRRRAVVRSCWFPRALIRAKGRASGTRRRPAASERREIPHPLREGVPDRYRATLRASDRRDPTRSK